MTVENIFSKMAARMVEGLMFHSKMADYYGFLGLDGYAKCHRYHYFEENIAYRKISDYYLHHCGKIIEEMQFRNPEVIPETWFKYKRTDVSAQTRKSSVQMGLEKWVEWETGTKKLYEECYKELININEFALAFIVENLIEDVDDELAKAEQKHLERVAIDFDIFEIMSEQKEIKKKYERKLKELKLC